MTKIDLFRLLPEVHRMEDARRGDVLAALLDAVSERMDEVYHDIEDLWDDFFVETCADWVVPYLGDLVANRALHEVGQRGRADVFKTIRYRRRKGTVANLEEVARDVTRWGVAVVPFFESLEWSQHTNHLRMRPASKGPVSDLARWNNPPVLERTGTANIRDADRASLVGGAFDVMSHSADVRAIGQRTGWHNIGNVGVFVWRLREFAVTGARPRAAIEAGPGCFHISPLGNPLLLFHPALEVDEREVADETAVPAPIRPEAMYFRTADYYGHGSGKAVGVYVGGTDERDLVPVEDVVVKDLSAWSPPSPGRVAVDVRLGRLCFGAAPAGDVHVTYHYGFSADVGGGPYDRRRLPSGSSTTQATVATPTSLDRLVRVPTEEATITAALASWDPSMHPSVVIQIEDSRTYRETLDINARAGRVVLQAQNLERPVIEGDIFVQGDQGDGVVVLDGLTVAGRVLVGAALRGLRIAHCSLVPGVTLDEDASASRPDQPSIEVDPANVDTELMIEASVLGPVRMPAEARGLVVRDSIIDSPGRSRVRARQVPVLVSARIPSFTGLSGATPRIQVRSESFGPFTVEVSGSSTTLADLADGLEKAVRGAHTDANFTQARVLSLPGRRQLVLVSGGDSLLTIRSAESDPTATEAGFDVSGSYATTALLGGPVDWAGLRTTSVELTVTDSSNKVYAVSFESVATSLATFRGELQRAIRAASPSQALASVLVARDSSRLVVVPGAAGTAFALEGTDTDPSTVLDLGLDLPLPAVSSGLHLADFGPRTVLERSTALGTLLVRTLSASDALLTDPVEVERRQEGCVRFSYVMPGSQTPRRYRCQPDLALELVQGAARLAVADRLRPRYTSVHFGDAGYCQLSLSCPVELRTGAEDGSEMGVFAHLRQPQREANLRIRLEEYLPFGLRAGVVFVT